MRSPPGPLAREVFAMRVFLVEDDAATSASIEMMLNIIDKRQRLRRQMTTAPGMGVVVGNYFDEIRCSADEI